MLEQKIIEAFENKTRRIYEGELRAATENYQHKVDQINDRTAQADIHTSLIANGVIEIIRG